MEFNGDVHSVARLGPQPSQPACRQLKHMDWAFNRTGPGGRRCDVIWTHSANRPAKGTNPVEKLVPTTGLEPVRCYSLEPESSASANSATWALRQFKSSGRMIRHAAAYLAPPVGAEQAKTKSHAGELKHWQSCSGGLARLRRLEARLNSKAKWPGVLGTRAT